MSKRSLSDNRTIHPRALKELGEEACIVALGVARDLRSGVIPPEKYDQYRFGHTCETPCCIAWHIASRLGFEGYTIKWADPLVYAAIAQGSRGLDKLFGAGKSVPRLAADAIERYVYTGSETPWTPA